MEISDFLKKFGGIFEETAPETILANTPFKEIPEWSSLLILYTRVLADEEYGVEIDGDEIRQLTTVEDIFNLIKGKVG